MSEASPSTADRPSVHAVVVSWNRRELLAECLPAVLSQDRAPDQVHVVDNSSTDGSAELVRGSFPNVHLHVLHANTGGAGGFAAGLAYALAGGADLVWLMDDDTIPRPGALSALLRAWADYPVTRPAVVASRVVWSDGRDHPMNTPRQRPGVTAQDRRAAAAVGCLPIRSASFVSILVEAAEVAASGLPQADFFLWNDDFEFTTRLLRHRVGLACPASVVEHRTRTFGATDADPGERFRLEVRNKIWTFARSDGLAAREKVLYGGATLRRWGRTFARSSNRRLLTRMLAQGLKEGIRQQPRRVDRVLEAAGVDPDVASLRGAGRGTSADHDNGRAG